MTFVIIIHMLKIIIIIILEWFWVSLKSEKHEPKIGDEINNDGYLENEADDLHQVFNIDLEGDKDQVLVHFFSLFLVIEVALLLKIDKPIDDWQEEARIEKESQVRHSRTFDVPEAS